MYYQNPQLLFGGSRLDPVFDGVTAAWPLSEGTNKMRREVFGSGADFFPQGVTTVSSQTKFSGSTNSYMTAPDIGMSLNTDEAFTWFMVITPSSLGAGTFDILCKGETVFGASAEYRVYLSGASLNFRIYYDTSSNTTVSANLTNGVNNYVFLVHNPASNIISIKVSTSAPTTAAHTGGTNRCRAKYGSLTLGNTCGTPFTPSTRPLISTTSANVAISSLIFWKGTALTSAQQTTVRGIITTTGFPWGALSEVDYTLSPDDYSAVSGIQRYKFTDFTGQWQDAAKTMAVNSNNHPIRVIESYYGGGEEATAPNDAGRPLAKTSTLNGLPTAYSDGSTSSMDLTNEFQTADTDFVIFIVAKNDANSRSPAGGSHWLSHRTNGAVYFAHTGSNYGNGYVAAHKSQGPTPNGPVNSNWIIYPTDFNVMEITSVSSVWNAISNGYSPLTGARDVPNIGAAEFKALFVNAPSKVAAEWWALGNCADIIYIPGTFTATERARMRKALDLEYNIISAYAGY